MFFFFIYVINSSIFIKAEPRRHSSSIVVFYYTNTMVCVIPCEPDTEIYSYHEHIFYTSIENFRVFHNAIH